MQTIKTQKIIIIISEEKENGLTQKLDTKKIKINE